MQGTPDPGPVILTNSHHWGYDGDQERSKEHVDVAVEARQPPRAGVPQAQHVGIAMVYLDVSILGVLCREGRAYLEEGARKGAGVHVRHGTAKQGRTFGNLENTPPSPDPAFPGPSCLHPQLISLDHQLSGICDHREAASQNKCIHLAWQVRGHEASPPDYHSATDLPGKPESLRGLDTRFSGSWPRIVIILCVFVYLGNMCTFIAYFAF